MSRSLEDMMEGLRSRLTEVAEGLREDVIENAIAHSGIRECYEGIRQMREVR